MKSFKRQVLSKVFAAALAASSISNAIACTAMVITDMNGIGYNGKTMEYAQPIPLQMQYIPAGTKMVSMTPSGSDGMTFVTKFAILGGGMRATKASHQDTMVEAMNDQGLSVSSNEMDGSQSPVAGVGADNGKVLAATDLVNWMLGNYRTVAEVKQALQSGEVKVWLPKIPFMNNAEFPIHYVVFDKTGSGIVIEYLNGVQNVYDNPVGAVANEPEFPWHLKNLNNYAQLTNIDKNTGRFGNLQVRAPDNGNALANLPSSHISADRFVKAAFYTTYVRKAKNPEDAVITLAHILNNFDRPYDLSIDLPSGSGSGREGASANSTSSEVTIFTWIGDKARNRYYLRTIGSMNFAMFDMNKLVSLNTTVKVPFANINDSTLDGTQLLLNAAK